MINTEINMVTDKANQVADDQWANAEQAVSEELGYSDAVVQIEHLKNQIEGLQNQLAALEGTIIERAKPATKDDYRQAGLDVMVNQYGKGIGVPKVFGRNILTVWDCLILTHLNQQVAFFQVYHNLQQLQHVIRRELLLCGDFVEARLLYQRFHGKIREALGDEIPGMLAEVAAIPALKAGEEA